MKQNTKIYILASVITVTLTVLAYALQMYRFTSLEEEYIFLYDLTYNASVLAQAGGLSQLMASALTQFFICRFAGPLITGIVYGIITFTLCAIARRNKAPLYIAALSAVPSISLMLCLENTSYEYQGTAALLICTISIYVYTLISDRNGAWPRLICGASIGIFAYWVAGSAAWAFVICGILYDLCKQKKYALADLIYPLLLVGFITAIYGIAILKKTVLPEMYYDMGSTYYMYVYAMVSLPVYILAVTLMSQRKEPTKSTWSIIATVAVVIAEFGIGMNLYTKIHSKSNYQNHQQRYYARHGKWDEIIAMDYDGSQTPYTSYIFLALAEKGKLAETIGQYRPYISYIFENKPKVKKRDQQVYSDIYYACDYMAAARHSAFDTDIVTPGAFNPYETQKLAAINIAYGDYAVAEKLLAMLEKTLYYSDWAKGHKKFLYDDEAVEKDAELGRMRRSIPPENFYLSPKGIMRDLKHIITVNPSQTTAEQFYKAFLILTNQEDR